MTHGRRLRSYFAVSMNIYGLRIDGQGQVKFLLFRIVIEGFAKLLHTVDVFRPPTGFRKTFDPCGSEFASSLYSAKFDRCKIDLRNFLSSAEIWVEFCSLLNQPHVFLCVAAKMPSRSD